MQTSKIKRLSEKVIVKIAAGQVADRPASIVKELVENSLDANAQCIVVNLEKSGIKKIEVVDDGEGMNPSDLKESYKSHTTSKITSYQDLVLTNTFGFRGEALASIAAFSNVEIRSRTKNDKFGYSITVLKGRLVDENKKGMKKGTRITVTSLYASEPARKESLKDPRTEINQITNMLINYATTHPKKEFVLTNNTKTVFRFKPETQKSRIRKIVGKSLFSQMIKVRYDEDHLKIDGYISFPSAAYLNTGFSEIFVNKRPVKNLKLIKEIRAAYQTLIPEKYKPCFMLFFTVPPATFDKNVDPKKETIKFINDKKIEKTVNKLIRKTLESKNLNLNIAFSGFDKKLAETIKSKGKLWDAKPTKLAKGAQVIILDNLYILIKTNQGLALVDQHAAHERILYSEYTKSFNKQKKSSFRLKKPMVFKPGQKQILTLKLYSDNLKKSGFDLEIKENGEVKILSAPLLYKNINLENLIKQVIEEAGAEFTSSFEETVAYVACRSAIKEGDTLTKIQARRLVNKLLKTKDYTSCPHGRPTIISITRDNLDHMFKRK